MVYALGVSAYIIAIMQRTTIGVAGVAATTRFHTDATLLSTLAVVQLAVYAIMQIPVGLLIDRLGTRAMLLMGTLVMFLGQLVVAFASDIGWAVVGRMLVGLGDAAIFTSVVRLTANWFSPRIVPALNQMLGSLGQIGQILSAVPFAWLLGASGWTVAFASAAACSVLALIILHWVPASSRETAFEREPVWASIRQAWARPGTRLGLWTTCAAQASGFAFTLMWGLPYMSYALGYAPTTAAQLLVVTVVAGAISGPFLGMLSSRYPMWRTRGVLCVVMLMTAAWAIMLATPCQPPAWLLFGFLAILGISIPCGVIGFDHAASDNAPEHFGAANGIVNMGGFMTAVFLIVVIGKVLDVRQRFTGAPGVEGLYSLSGFRLAFAVQFVAIALGATMMWRTQRQLEAETASR